MCIFHAFRNFQTISNNILLGTPLRVTLHFFFSSNKKTLKENADLDEELEGYDVENSDDGLDADDRILLENARGRKLPQEEVKCGNRLLFERKK